MTLTSAQDTRSPGDSVFDVPFHLVGGTDEDLIGHNAEKNSQSKKTNEAFHDGDRLQRVRDVGHQPEA